MRKILVLFSFLVSLNTAAQSENDSDFLCDQVGIHKDDFTDNVTIRTKSYIAPNIIPMALFNLKDKSGSHYYLHLSVRGSTLNVGEKGVILLFEDGTKLNYNTKIDVESTTGSKWSYTAYVPIDISDIEILMSKKISKFRLYIYDETVNPKAAEDFIIMVKCLMKNKGTNY